MTQPALNQEPLGNYDEHTEIPRINGLSDVLFQTLQHFLVEESVNFTTYPISRAHLIHQVYPLLDPKDPSYGVIFRTYKIGKERPKHLWDGQVANIFKTAFEHAATAFLVYTENYFDFDIGSMLSPFSADKNLVLRVGTSMFMSTLVTIALEAPGYPFHAVSTCMALDNELETPRNLSISQWLNRILYVEHNENESEGEDDNDEEKESKLKKRKYNLESIQRLTSGLFLKSFHYVLNRFLSQIVSNSLIRLVNKPHFTSFAIEFAAIISRVITSGFLYPLTTVHSRLLAQYILDEDDERRYNGVIDCVQKMYQNEGIFAFYRGWASPLGLDVILRILF